MSDRLTAARRAVASERRRVVAEREAFAEFEARVADLSVVAMSTTAPVVNDHREDGPSLQRVRSVYESTVMGVPHYDAEYGDDVADSLAAEFGTDLAAAVVGSTTLTPELREAVVSAAAARQEREAFVDVLDREDESLAAAVDAVETLRADFQTLDDRPLDDRDFDALRDVRSELSAFEARIDGISMRRQEVIDGHRSDLPGIHADLTEYLYDDLDVSYPVLATLADFGRLVEGMRRRVDRALASAL
ncbi:MAG: hypothetical protein ABEJ82_08715 [Haloplanus sp.]